MPRGLGNPGLDRSSGERKPGTRDLFCDRASTSEPSGAGPWQHSTSRRLEPKRPAEPSIARRAPEKPAFFGMRFDGADRS